MPTEPVPAPQGGASPSAEPPAAPALAGGELPSRLLEAVGQAVVAIDPERRVIFWNDAATRLYGWTRAEALGRPIADVIPPAKGWRDEVSKVRAVVEQGRAWAGDFWVQRKDGVAIPILSTNTPVYDDAGELIAWLAVSSDQTERALLMEQVEEDGRRMREAQRSAQLGSFEYDRLTGRESWSDELFRIMGMAPEMFASIDQVAHRVHPDDRALYAGFRAGFLAGQHVAPCTVRVIRDDESTRWAEIKASPRPEGSSVFSGTVLDVTDRMVAQAELVHRAHHDPLTNLPNRAMISELLERALDGQERTGVPMAVAFVDLDQFKVINDSLGHGVGDQILIAVADRLREFVAPDDVVGRFGGDEFIVLRAGCPDADGAIGFADRLRGALDVPVVADGNEFALVASVGVALSRPDDTPATVLRDADAAMYYAKERGRNRAEVFDEQLRRRTQDKLAMVRELRLAWEQDQFHLEYQPILSLATQAVVGFEALLRWDHPDRGEMGPNAFIPAAEESGLIVAIGDWVLTQAVTQLASWRGADPALGDLFVSINLSAKELANPGLLASVEAVLAGSDVPAERIRLEVTESAVMENVEHSVRTARAIRRLGVGLSIDDFGTGYSSLSYLKQLPVDTLKIDQSFVSGLGHDLQDRSIAEAIIALGQALGLEVLAEGVETAGQAATLAELGCQLAQGFLWSRPVRPEAAIGLVGDARRWRTAVPGPAARDPDGSDQSGL
ncbi:MAG: hypothetical protein JWM47_801 [Acidimicrobiales bacterium]|nr:hypothetical protein [Acidimicrobiales bacterium]